MVVVEELREEEARPQPLGMAVWRQVLLLGACFGSAMAALYIGNKYVRDAAGNPQYILAHIPFFFLLMALEGLLGSGHLTVGGKYEFADSISSLGAGIFQQINIRVVERPFTTAVGLFPYKYIYDHYGQRFGTPLVGDVDSVLAWVLTFVGIDFAYYWFHRAGHEINFIWASHSVHHSSEHYNLTTALRQSAIQSWFKLAFYLPLAFLFPVPVYLALSQWNTLYQFWVHTTLIRRLGPLEWVFNTPSHHRVHHDRRVHRNYGGTLIVWDRMFGTFMDEHDEPASGKERVVYGTLTSPASWNPITVQLAPMRQLFRKVCAAPTWRRAAHTFFVGPGYRPKLHRSEPPHVSGRVIRLRYRTHLEAAPNYFLLLQSATHMVALGLILVQAKHMTQSALTALLLGLCVTPLVLCGAMLDGRPWARAFEPLRAFASAGVAFWLACVGHEVAWMGCQPSAVLGQRPLLVLGAINVLLGVIATASPSVTYAHFMRITSPRDV